MIDRQKEKTQDNKETEKRNKTETGKKHTIKK